MSYSYQVFGNPIALLVHMTTNTRYNGWTNYETWAVALWLDNDEGTSIETRETMREFWDTMADADERMRYGINNTQSEATRFHFSQWLEDYVETMQPDLGATLWSDLLNAAMSEVDWFEIADNWLSELDEYEPKEHAHAHPQS